MGQLQRRPPARKMIKHIGSCGRFENFLDCEKYSLHRQPKNNILDLLTMRGTRKCKKLFNEMKENERKRKEMNEQLKKMKGTCQKNERK